MTEEELLSSPDFVHTVSVSGGKDSCATYCTALEKGVVFRAVAADTGNEHPHTYDQVNNLHVWTGGPQVEWVKADFTDHIRAKRDYIARGNWTKPRRGSPAVPQDLIERAIAVLDDRLAHPEQANPYLDMCLWKGRFPSRKAQFCTEALKVEPIQAWQKQFLSEGRTVISWQGVRASESFERSLLQPIQELNPEAILGEAVPGRLIAYRPLLHVESVEGVFAIAARHGVPANPLYGWGLSRVGCFPCVNCAKAELALVGRFFPEQIDRLERWERLVSEAGRRRGHSTFFAIVNDPVMASEMAYQAAKGTPLKITTETHGIRRMVEWAGSGRGGRARNLFFDEGPITLSACHVHGACE